LRKEPPIAGTMIAGSNKERTLRRGLILISMGVTLSG